MRNQSRRLMPLPLMLTPGSLLSDRLAEVEEHPHHLRESDLLRCRARGHGATAALQASARRHLAAGELELRGVELGQDRELCLARRAAREQPEARADRRL